MTDESTRAKAFAELPPEGFVRIAGVDDDPSDWHINDKFMFSTGSDAAEALLAQFTSGDADIEFPDAKTTCATIFQRGDASTEWLVVIVTQSGDDEWSFEDMKLAGLTPGDYEDVEGDIDILDTGPNKASLGETNE